MQAGSERSILLVEDEVLVASDLERILKRAGYVVIGPAGSVAEALVQIVQQNIDGAVLNIKVGQELTSPVLDVLAGAHIPFVFVSSYPKDLVPLHYRGRPFVTRPYLEFKILKLLANSLPMRPKRNGIVPQA
jgi:two-component SAPR family response regulator